MFTVTPPRPPMTTKAHFRQSEDVTLLSVTAEVLSENRGGSWMWSQNTVTFTDGAPPDVGLSTSTPPAGVVQIPAFISVPV